MQQPRGQMGKHRFQMGEPVLSSRCGLNDWEKESRKRPWSLESFIVDKCELGEHWWN